MILVFDQNWIAISIYSMNVKTNDILFYFPKTGLSVSKVRKFQGHSAKAKKKKKSLIKTNRRGEFV